MRAVTLRQPIPWALIHAGCDVINMPRSAPVCPSCGDVYGSNPIRSCCRTLRVLIHAGKDYEATHWINRRLSPEERLMRAIMTEKGALVAVATITGSHEAETCLDRCDRCHGSGEIWHDSAGCSPCPDCNGVGSHRNCSPWAEFPGWGLYHWQVSEVVPFDVPVPCRGRPGLWTPPPDVLSKVEAQSEGGL